MSIGESADPGTDVGGAADDDVRATGHDEAVPAQRRNTRRQTVDLPPDVHRDLKAWCVTAADELDRASVSQADVVRLLLLRLHSDPELRRFIITSLRDRRR